ncbi:hypothetical protein nbrc107696_42700 [Gordonia spumicola]|uniref:Uncharacterized protein n=1 Tax=Gordonia spumicola TaxID=589161 RepID=A0A7I9VES6_9ACTN|nr:hypothetical protein [Gordonia spumicola]GEE03824.1 hypothetical protein nbrc107696_42700 [Gordonia spumicola]
MTDTQLPTSKPHILTRWHLMRGPRHLHIVVVVLLVAATLLGGVLTGQRFPTAEPSSLAYEPCSVADQGPVNYGSTGSTDGTADFARLASQFSGKVAVLGSTALTTWFAVDSPAEVVQSIYLAVPFGAVPPRAGVIGDLIATKPMSQDDGYSIWAVVRTIENDESRYATMDEVLAHPEWLTPTDYEFKAFTAFQCPVID